MHVAFLAPGWPLETYPNGIVTYVHWMREELRRQGHRVSVLTGGLKAADDGVREVKDSFRLRARRWLEKRSGSADPYAFGWGEALAAEINRAHRQTPIDVLEMEESFGWSAAVQRQVSVPVVVKLHGPAFLSLVEEELDSDFGRLKIEREGAALREARCITSPSRATLEETILRYDLRPVIARHVVNPLSLPLTAPIWSLDTCRRDTILFVGRFDKRKGGDLVLRAFAALLRTNPSLRLIFVGPDAGLKSADRPAVHIKEMLGRLLPGAASAQVDYRGVVAPAEIYGIRAQALVTIVASRWENHSYTALEAMLQGCPLVSSDAGGQPEFIIDGRTGLLAKAGEVSDLCTKIKVLIDDPQRAARLGASARNYVQTHHSPASVVEQTLAVYHAAIQSSRSEISRALS